MSASRSIGLPNPWEKFPQLEELTSGMARELRLPVRRKEGITEAMMLRMLSLLEARNLKYND